MWESSSWKVRVVALRSCTLSQIPVAFLRVCCQKLLAALKYPGSMSYTWPVENILHSCPIILLHGLAPFIRTSIKCCYNVCCSLRNGAAMTHLITSSYLLYIANQTKSIQFHTRGKCLYHSCTRVHGFPKQHEGHREWSGLVKPMTLFSWTVLTESTGQKQRHKSSLQS